MMGLLLAISSDGEKADGGKTFGFGWWWRSCVTMDARCLKVATGSEQWLAWWFSVVQGWLAVRMELCSLAGYDLVVLGSRPTIPWGYGGSEQLTSVMEKLHLSSAGR